MSDQQTLFNDPSIAAEERDVFGDDLRPSQVRLDSEGDYIHGYVVEIEKDVDLKTGFAPVDIVTIDAIGGVHKGGTERLQVGRRYAFPLMHATAKNQVAALDPEPASGERIGIRRQRDFQSTQGPSEGKMIAGYLAKMPDRPVVETKTEPAKTSGTTDAKATKASGTTDAKV